MALERETDPIALAEAKPANAWLGALDIGDDATKRHFMLQCAFCHQQGNAFMRMDRTPQAVERRHLAHGRLRLAALERRPEGAARHAGGRLAQAARAPGAAAGRGAVVRRLASADDHRVADRRRRCPRRTTCCSAANGNVYVADNIQDRLYQIDPRTNEVTVFKIPHRPATHPADCSRRG